MERKTCKYMNGKFCSAHSNATLCPMLSHDMLECEDYFIETHCVCDEKIDVDIVCDICKEVTTIRLNPLMLQVYDLSDLDVHTCFPDLNRDECNLIKYGICSKCGAEN